MLHKLKTFFINRKEKRDKPWNKKRKIIFLSFFGVAVTYAVISMILSGNKTEQPFVLPQFDFYVNGFDIVMLCVLIIAFIILKIFKHRKGNGK